MKRLTPAQIRKALHAAGLTMPVSGRDKAIQCIRANPGIVGAEIVKRTGMNRTTVSRLTRELEEAGLILGGSKPPRNGHRSERGFVWIGGDE